MMIVGDFDGNKKIDVFDLVGVKMVILDIIQPTQEQVQRGDANQDGQISVTDILRITQHLRALAIIDEVIE